MISKILRWSLWSKGKTKPGNIPKCCKRAELTEGQAKWSSGTQRNELLQGRCSYFVIVFFLHWWLTCFQGAAFWYLCLFMVRVSYRSSSLKARVSDSPLCVKDSSVLTILWVSQKGQFLQRSAASRFWRVQPWQQLTIYISEGHMRTTNCFLKHVTSQFFLIKEISAHPYIAIQTSQTGETRSWSLTLLG